MKKNTPPSPRPIPEQPFHHQSALFCPTSRRLHRASAPAPFLPCWNARWPLILTPSRPPPPIIYVHKMIIKCPSHTYILIYAEGTSRQVVHYLHPQSPMHISLCHSNVSLKKDLVAANNHCVILGTTQKVNLCCVFHVVTWFTWLQNGIVIVLLIATCATRPLYSSTVGHAKFH